MFEVISHRAKIIIVPEKEDIYFHGCRDLVTYGECLPEPFSEKYNWKMPPFYPQIKSLEDAIHYASKMNPGKQEGFVVRDIHFK